MQVQCQSFTVHKRFPLTISRGTTAQTTNLWVRIEQDGIEGWGEASPFSIGEQPQTTEAIAAAITAITPQLTAFHPCDRQQLAPLVASLPSAAQAALDLALHDWLGKFAGLPLWRLWGLDRTAIVPTSVTIGINPPDLVQKRVLDWLDVAQPKVLKVKLGNPAGIEADQQMLQAVLAVTPAGTQVNIDANGGWSLEQAIAMSHWLADQGINSLEQPLARGQESLLPELYRQSPLPIFVDESCFTSQDIVALADRVHGVNIKLMKCGGLSEALRMVHTAKACGLLVMFGCYSDSTLMNTAAAQLSPLADYLDLDSHLNLLDDPFSGATLEAGRLIPNDLPGLGVQYRAAN